MRVRRAGTAHPGVWTFSLGFQAEGLRYTSPGQSPWVRCPLGPLQANGLPHHITQPHEGMFGAKRTMVWTTEPTMMQAVGLRIPYVHEPRAIALGWYE